MKIRIIPLLCLVLISSLLAQDAEYPVATPTDQPDVVISPYDSTRRLDVEGLDPGSLAEDPIAKKIFRIPYSNSAKRYYDDHPAKLIKDELPPPPIEAGASAPPVSGPHSPSWIPVSKELPTDLLNFVYAFNQNSTVNDPNALIPFFAAMVDNYFGDAKVSHSAIRADRKSYLKRYPQREYIFEEPPVLLSQKGNVYEVMTRVRYAVGGNGRTRTGSVSDYFKIRRGSRRFEIISINEAKAAAAPADVQQRDIRRFLTLNPSKQPLEKETVYSRFEVEQISLFLDAFAASGEVSEPTAMIEFLHQNPIKYYDMVNPKASAILKDRQNYIKRWPERRYWLTEKPTITSVSPGAWEIVVKTGYEVKKGSKTATGVSISDLRLVYTNFGMKIVSITTR